MNNNDITSLPFVSTMIVVRNEEKYIKHSLESLINQDYPVLRYEIIIVDGESNDKTIEYAHDIIISEKEKIRSLPKITFLNNPNHLLASGWNIGIKASQGDYVVRIDAHAEACHDFLRKSVETILSVNADCVGGKLITKSADDNGKLVSDILSSPFGVGNSSFRVSNSPGYADTAVYGLYKKRVLCDAGCFNETLVRNQDIECHTRIKKAGGKFYFNPNIISVYYSRTSVKKMLQQAFQNGKWNIITKKKNNTQLSIRHIVPLAFLLFLICSTVGGFIFNKIWSLEMAVMILYVVLALFASLNKTQTLKTVAQMIVLFFLLHISYGVGSFVGFFSKD